MANRIYVTKASVFDRVGRAMLAVFLLVGLSLQGVTTHAEDNPSRRLAETFFDIPPLSPAERDKICAPKPEMTSKAKFSSAGLRGRLVDIDDEKPIEGVLVVAIWSAQPRARVRPTTVRGFVHIAETQTDREGRFTIPAWGPLGIMIPYEYGKEKLMSTLVRADPELVIYSPVYGIITKDPEDQTAYPRRMRPGEISVGKFEGIELRTRPYSNNEDAFGKSGVKNTKALVFRQGLLLFSRGAFLFCFEHLLK
jgi:hypothetical protein